MSYTVRVALYPSRAAAHAAFSRLVREGVADKNSDMVSRAYGTDGKPRDDAWTLRYLSGGQEFIALARSGMSAEGEG